MRLVTIPRTKTDVGVDLRVQTTVTNVISICILRKIIENNSHMDKNGYNIEKTAEFCKETLGNTKKAEGLLGSKEVQQMAKLLSEDKNALATLGLQADIKLCNDKIMQIYGEGAKHIALIVGENNKEGVAFLIKDLWPSKINNDIKIINSEMSNQYGYNDLQISYILEQMTNNA